MPSEAGDLFARCMIEFEKAKGMKSIRMRMYTAAHTRPMHSGLHTFEFIKCLQMEITHIGSLYILSRSLPFRWAETNTGPRRGIRCNVAKNEKTENPTDTYSADRGGTGSSKGLATNHNATGTNPKSSTLGKGLGLIATLDILTT